MSIEAETRALADRVESILRARGADAQAAAEVADVMLEADRRGVVTHGITRLASYVERIRLGQLDPTARPTVVSDGGGVVLLDAGRGFGAVAGIHATRLAMSRAREHGGCAWVTTRSSNHFGIAGYYTAMLAREGFLGFACCNAGASMPATGGTSAVVGTNPASFAVPGGDRPPVLDMAMTHVARGKIRRAAAEGRTIPPDWATDANGVPTTDPETAIAGMMAPMAGHKGYATSAMVELMCGVLSGGPVSTGVRGATDYGGDAGVSFSVFAVDLSRIVDIDTYAGRVDELREQIEATAAPGQRTHLPGGPQDVHAEEVAQRGLTVPEDVLATLARLESEDG